MARTPQQVVPPSKGLQLPPNITGGGLARPKRLTLADMQARGAAKAAANTPAPATPGAPADLQGWDKLNAAMNPPPAAAPNPGVGALPVQKATAVGTSKMNPDGTSTNTLFNPPPLPGSGGAGTDDYWAQAQQEYADLMADDAQSWQDQQGALQGEMAGFSRAADSINARMGGGIGGGSAGLAGAALGEGMKAYNAAAMDYANQRRATQLAWLDKQIAHGERLQEKTWDDEARTEDWERQLMQMAAEMDVPIEELRAMLEIELTPEEQAAEDARNQAAIESGAYGNIPESFVALMKENDYSEADTAAAWEKFKKQNPGLSDAELREMWEWQMEMREYSADAHANSTGESHDGDFF